VIYCRGLKTPAYLFAWPRRRLSRVTVAGPPRFEPRAVSRRHGFSARGRSEAAGAGPGQWRRG